MSRHLSVIVGVACLCLFQQAAQATSLPPPSSITNCEAHAGIGEAADNEGCGDPAPGATGVGASALWPLNGVNDGSGVRASASVFAGDNQTISAVATIDQADGIFSHAQAGATLTYYIVINPNSLPGSGPTGVHIPITFKGTGELDAPEFFENIGTNPFASASESLTIQTAGSPFEADGQYLNGAVSGNLTGNPISGTIDLLTGTAYTIMLTAEAEMENETGSLKAQIDPIFSFANSDDALKYEIDFSDGITNGVSNTPLPAAFPMFAGGLGMIGLLARRRRRNAATIVAA
jgi:hypothetical protein